MFLCFFQQFHRLAYVSRAWFYRFIPPSFVYSGTTWFKLNHLRLLTVLRVVYAIVFGLDQTSLILCVDLLSCRYFDWWCDSYVCEHVTHFTRISATWHVMLECTWGRSPAFQKLEEKLWLANRQWTEVIAQLSRRSWGGTHDKPKNVCVRG